MATILIVDDDQDIRSVIRLAVAAEGHQVLMASGGQKALEVIRSHTLDLVVLDIMMPETSGWNVLSELRKNSRTKRLPVIVLSALGETSSKVRGLRAGADDYLAKPFDPDELIARIEALLLRRREKGAGLQGRIEEHSLPEIAQSLEQNSRTGTLYIEGLDESGLMELKGGRVQLARHGHLEGRDALLAMLSLREGQFRFEIHAPSETDSGEGFQITSILMESAWLEDELAKRAGHLPPDNALVSLADQDREPSVPDGFGQLPFGEILEAIRSAGPTAIADLLQVVSRAPACIRLAIAWLSLEGYLVRPSEEAERADQPVEEPASTLLNRIAAAQANPDGGSEGRGILIFHTGEEERILGWVEEFAEVVGAGVERVLGPSGDRLILHGSKSSLSIHCRDQDSVAEAGDTKRLAVIISITDPQIGDRRLDALLSTVEWTVSSYTKLYLILPDDALTTTARLNESAWRIEPRSTFTLTRIFEDILADPK